MTEKSSHGTKSGPGAVLRFSLLVVYSYLQVFSAARVATWCALEVPWGQTCDLCQVRTWDILQRYTCKEYQGFFSRLGV